MSVLKTFTLEELTTCTRASTATYLDTDNVLKIAAVNTVRLHYDVAADNLGALIEGQKTNLFLQSEAFDNAVWTKTNSSVTANSTTAPDGLTTADTLTDASASFGVITQTVTISGSVSYSFSVFVKKDADSSRSFGMGLGGGGADYEASFRTDTGAFLQKGAGIDLAVSEDYGSYWRFKITGIPFDGSFRLLPAYGTDVSTGAASAAATGSVIAWGAQVELGMPSSYIPTNGSQATRAADSFVADNFTDFSRYDKGALVFEFDRPALSSGIACLWVINEVSGDTVNSYKATMNLSTAAVTITGRVGSSDVIALAVGNAVAGRNKIAFSFENANFRGTLNSGTIQNEPDVPFATPIKRFVFGAFDTAQHWNARIFKIKYFPRTLTDAELLAMTA